MKQTLVSEFDQIINYMRDNDNNMIIPPVTWVRIRSSAQIHRYILVELEMTFH